MHRIHLQHYRDIDMFGRGYFRHAQGRGKVNRNRRRHIKALTLSSACQDSEDSEACKRLSRSLCVGSSPNPSSFAMFVQLHAQESSQELAELFESLNKVPSLTRNVNWLSDIPQLLFLV